MNAVPAWNTLTIFAVIIVIVGFSMFMGQKHPRHGTRGGWWAGLIVLLIVLSAFFGTAIFRSRSVQEVRYAGRATWTEEIQNHVREAKEQASEAVEEAKRAMSSAMKRGEKARSRNRDEIHEVLPTVPPVMTSSAPLREVVFDVSLPKNERTQKLDELEKRLKDKAADRVSEWVKQMLPYRVWIGRFVSPEFLEAKGAFPHPVEPLVEEVPRPDSSKDPLYNGTLKVVLSTSLQQQLLNDGFRIVGERLQEEKLMQQSIIFFLLIGSSIAAGGIGTLCYVHRLWKSRHAELALGRGVTVHFSRTSPPLT